MANLQGVHPQFKRFGLFLILGLSACQPAVPLTSQSPALPQDANIQVYTNHQPSAQYREPYRPQTRSGDNLEQVLIDGITSARSHIDIAVQEFRLPKIAQALADRTKAGVKVRLILENTYARPWSAFSPAEIEALTDREQANYREAFQLMDENRDGALSATEIQTRDALVILDQAQIPRIDDSADGSRGSDLMHHKFMVIDGQTVWVGSVNWTLSDIHGDLSRSLSRGNANHLLKLTSPDLARRFTEEFDLMWGTGEPQSRRFGLKKPYRPPQVVQVGSTPIAVQFSPTSPRQNWVESTNGLIAHTLSQAKQSVDLALFVFSDQQIANALEPLSQAGVKLRALVEPGFIYRPYSEALDLLGVTLRDRCQVEAGNHPWSTPIETVGAPHLPPGDKLHHKFGIIDQTTVITGSHNWTEAANQGNDETLLVIQNPIVAAHFQREFDRLYQDAKLGLPPAIRRKADMQAQECAQGLTDRSTPQSKNHQSKRSKSRSVFSQQQRHPSHNQRHPDPADQGDGFAEGEITDR